MKTFTAFFAAVAVGTMALASADDDIMARQALMKQVGAAAKARDLPAMADAAEQALVAFQADTSGQGSVETKAANNIWTDFGGFEAIMNDLITSARAGDGDAAFATCKTCHSQYRS